MRILVVDDSKAMRMIIERTLRLAGYKDDEVIQATNGQHALDVVSGSPPDLVLCDWNMPEMDGPQLLACMRDAGHTMPFGFVTSETSAHTRDRAMAEGARFFIAKPFTPEDFQDALDAVVA